MIARTSHARQQRLFPVCRVKYCRAAATETMLKDASPFWCQAHLRWALGLRNPPEAL